MDWNKDKDKKVTKKLDDEVFFFWDIFSQSPSRMRIEAITYYFEIQYYTNPTAALYKKTYITPRKIKNQNETKNKLKKNVLKKHIILWKRKFSSGSNDTMNAISFNL